MGRQDIKPTLDSGQLRTFTRHLLADLRAFQQMLEDGRFETGVTRIGAEQELFLIDRALKPATAAVELLEAIDDPHFTTELGAFNLELNLDPLEVTSGCFRLLEEDLRQRLEQLRLVGEKSGVDLFLAGILPTLDESDLTLESMTPVPRYYALNEAFVKARGGQWRLHIRGRDELTLRHDNVMAEACNTSFQLHLQVDPGRFAELYNLAQAVAAPVLAAATNSPLLFGRRLWRETRIALFEQSADTRRAAGHARDQQARVSFGRQWVEESALEIFREDISRFRVIVGLDVDEDPFEVLGRGQAPRLEALCLHNGTIYRWNRPCYGLANGKAHLRIENRVLPAGPTIVDEVANAAFWYGLMWGMPDAYGNIASQMDFTAARENFLAAARLGLGAQMIWPRLGDVPSRTLILEELLPIARAGLASRGIDAADVDRYLGVLEQRVRTGRTGSQFQLDALEAFHDAGREAERLARVVAVTRKRQRSELPVHEWEAPNLDDVSEVRPRFDRVADLMTTDLFTVNEEDVVDMVASVMKWRHLRRIPVEDAEHRLVGLVTHRSLLRVLSEEIEEDAGSPIPVRRIMKTRVISARPEMPTLDAIRLMQEHRIGCLPVVDQANRLVGILTDHDLMEIARPLLERALRDS